MRTLRLRGKAPDKGIVADGVDAAQLGVAGTVQPGAATEGRFANGLKGRRQVDVGQVCAKIKGVRADGLKRRRQGDADQIAMLKGMFTNVDHAFRDDELCD